MSAETLAIMVRQMGLSRYNQNVDRARAAMDHREDPPAERNVSFNGLVEFPITKQ